jgi:transposase
VARDERASGPPEPYLAARARAYEAANRLLATRGVVALGATLLLAAVGDGDALRRERSACLTRADSEADDDRGRAEAPRRDETVGETNICGCFRSMAHRPPALLRAWRTNAPSSSQKSPGVPRVDDRRGINGILWRFRIGAPWRDVPERYSPRMTLYNRFVRWRAAGVWDRVLDAVPEAYDDAIVMIDSAAKTAQMNSMSSRISKVCVFRTST